MKILIQKLIVLSIVAAGIQSDCDKCQSSNYVACHSENVYSLCINDVPTEDFITCPENYVCTSRPNVCYPRDEAVPSCSLKNNKIPSDCDKCQSSNYVACHSENEYSLCINGIPTEDFITCPDNHVCTSGPYVCYPLPEAKPTCVRTVNQCGVCSENKVYACVNETTIAFCYGGDSPMEGADVSYCPSGTVCDLHSEKGFCTESHLVKPSCIVESDDIDDILPPPSTTTTIEPTTTTTTTIEPTTTTTTMEPTTTITTIEPTTTTTTMEPTTTTTTMEPTTTTTTIEPTTTTTTMEPTTTTTTIEPTTTTTTMEPTTTTTTTEPTTTTTQNVPTAPRDPDTICKDENSTGSFYADDPTCKTFVVCYAMNGQILGLQKPCPDGQYFPPGGKICNFGKPDECI